MKNTKNIMLALCVVPFLTMPAFAGSLNAGNNPMVVAEDVQIGVGGVHIWGGERNRHRDRDVDLDREHRHHNERDQDRDRDHDRR